MLPAPTYYLFLVVANVIIKRTVFMTENIGGEAAS